MIEILFNIRKEKKWSNKNRSRTTKFKLRHAKNQLLEFNDLWRFASLSLFSQRTIIFISINEDLFLRLSIAANLRTTQRVFISTDRNRIFTRLLLISKKWPFWNVLWLGRNSKWNFDIPDFDLFNRLNFADISSSNFSFVQIKAKSCLSSFRTTHLSVEAAKWHSSRRRLATLLKLR